MTATAGRDLVRQRATYVATWKRWEAFAAAATRRGSGPTSEQDTGAAMMLSWLFDHDLLAATNRDAEPPCSQCGHPRWEVSHGAGGHQFQPGSAPSEPGPPALDVEAIDAALEFVIDHLDGFHTGECRCRQRIEAIRARLPPTPASAEEPR